MQREIMTRFINLYKDRPCLWNSKIPQYCNRHIRNKALNELLEIYKDIEPNANIASVRKKIDNLRTMYNRQRRKVILSEMSGCSPDLVYRPTMWYYKKMSFLKELDKPINGEVKQENTVEEDSEDSDNESLLVERPRRPVLKVRPLRLLKKPKQVQNEDELDCFSKMATKTLRKLEEPTQSIALKLMSDVLYHAKMGHLSEQSSLLTEANVDGETIVP